MGIRCKVSFNTKKSFLYIITTSVPCAIERGRELHEPAFFGQAIHPAVLFLWQAIEFS